MTRQEEKEAERLAIAEAIAAMKVQTPAPKRPLGRRIREGIYKVALTFVKLLPRKASIYLDAVILLPLHRFLVPEAHP